MTDIPSSPITLESLSSQISQIRDDVQYLMDKRLIQQDIVPDIIKTRHMGEGNRYMYSGLEANRPTGNLFGNSTTIYFATDTKKLWIWTGTVWVSVTLA